MLSKHLWRLSMSVLTTAVLTSLLASTAVFAMPVSGTVKAATEVRVEEDEKAKDTAADKPVHGFTFDGNFRYLYGQGHFEGESLTRQGKRYAMTPFKEMMIMQTLRTRLYANYNFDKNWKFVFRRGR
jgi:hypothetical protein